MVDVAEPDAQREVAAARGGIFTVEHHFKRAAVGKAGEMVTHRFLTRLFQILPQRLALDFAALDRLLELAGALDHALGDARKLADHRTGAFELPQLRNLRLHCVAVVAGGVARGGGGVAELLDRALEPRHQLG